MIQSQFQKLFPIESNHDYKRLAEMISLAPITIKKIYERKVFPKDETIRKLAIIGNNTFRNIYESLLDHFKDSGNLANCVSCGDLYYRKRDNQTACGKGLCRSYSSQKWYKQKKKLNENFKSHFSFNKYASRKKRFKGKPESIEDYLKRGGTVTKLKDEPEILLEIEMLL